MPLNAVVSPRNFTLSPFADAALKLSAGAWLLVAVTGQLVFVTYLLAFYGRSALRGDWAAWNAVAPHAHVAGDGIGNIAFAVHIVLAVLIILSGALQLIPQIRSRAPAFHRWNGRVYVSAVVATSFVGLYLVWFRHSVGDFAQHLGITLNAILIIAFATLAIREARARRFAAHRRWALRLFVVALGVWFFRLGLPLWIMINKGPAGFDPKTFTGPFLTFLSFGSYLLPLLVLELYLRARERSGDVGRIAMAAALAVLTFATIAGIAAATMILWRPHL